MKIRPVLFRWTEVDVCVDGGEVRRMNVMVPIARFEALCKRQFELNDDYALGPVEGVPSRSRSGFFGSIKRAWDNLPEDDKRFPTDEHLRKKALVEAGWARHTQSVFDTVKDAHQHALDLRKIDEYAVIRRSGTVVDCWIAKSIGNGQINGEQFQKVKTAALDWVATLARTTRAELEENAGMAS